MFIVERLIGVGIYFYFLAAVCLVIAFSDIRLKYITRAYTVILAAMGFLYKPYITADLYRINESLRQFSDYGFSRFYSIFVKDSSIPAARIFYWIIGKTGVSELLPALTCLIVYSSIFYIFVKSAEKYGTDRKSIAVTMFFIMSSGCYMMVISNIRTMIAISLICFCTYRETVEKKYSVFNIILYIIAALSHNLSVIILAIRIAIIVLDKRKTLAKRILWLAVFAIGLAVIALRFSYIFSSVFEKAISYITEDGYSYIWDYIIAVLAFIVEATALVYCMKKRKECPELTSNNNFLLLCLGLAVIFCYEFSIFHRLIIYISPVLSIPSLLFCLRSESGKKALFGVMYYRDFVLLISVISMVISCTRGSLCSLKFFEF